MHFHRGELIFNGECNVRALRVHDPATAEQHEIKDKGFIATNEWHEIVWQIWLDRMRVVVDGEVRFDGAGDYSGIEAAPSVGPCFGNSPSRSANYHHAAHLIRLLLPSAEFSFRPPTSCEF